jgi:hypothetical protein
MLYRSPQARLQGLWKGGLIDRINALVRLSIRLD